jgi:hypothetical protein
MQNDTKCEVSQLLLLHGVGADHTSGDSICFNTMDTTHGVAGVAASKG